EIGKSGGVGGLLDREARHRRRDGAGGSQHERRVTDRREPVPGEVEWPRREDEVGTSWGAGEEGAQRRRDLGGRTVGGRLFEQGDVPERRRDAEVAQPEPEVRLA